jgi:hypothetical protein
MLLAPPPSQVPLNDFGGPAKPFDASTRSFGPAQLPLRVAVTVVWSAYEFTVAGTEICCLILTMQVRSAD